jgi:co-chaperonin GroES (HSP10)
MSKTKVLKEYVGKITTWPTGHTILVKPCLADDVEEDADTYKQKGGSIVIPKDVAKRFAREQKSQQKGKVIAIGMIAYSDWNNGELWCDVGDYVYFTRHAGNWLTDEKSGEDFILMSDNDVNGVVSDTPPGWTAEDMEAHNDVW